jgi:exopolysaccharide biosynthesis predicted pyruvyltransferase EpsI
MPTQWQTFGILAVLPEEQVTCAAFVERNLRPALDAALGRHIPVNSRVVLVDYPQHRNAGDSAIYLGERQWIADGGHDLVHTCSLTTYEPEVIRRELRDGVILLHGGGNFGDLWPHWHTLRERVAADFPDRRLIQLPQTLHYSDQAAEDKARSAPLGRHEALTIITRDHGSRAKAAEIFSGAEIDLAPDMAFALGPQLASEATTDVLWLARSDHERNAAHGSIPTRDGVEVTDWSLNRRSTAAWWTMFALPKAANKLKRYPRVRRPVIRLSESVYEPMAHLNLRGALSTLSRGRVVVTDRLHAHILSVLLGRPHVVLDNSYGKVSSFVRAWTEGAPGVVSASGPSDALHAASAMLEGVPRRPQPSRLP